MILPGGDRSPFGDRINYFGDRWILGTKSRSPEGRSLDYFSVPLIAGGDQINYAAVAAIAKVCLFGGLKTCAQGLRLLSCRVPSVRIFCQILCFS